MTAQAIVQTIAAIAATGALIWWLYRLSPGPGGTGSPQRRGAEGELSHTKADGGDDAGASDSGGDGD